MKKLNLCNHYKLKGSKQNLSHARIVQFSAVSCIPAPPLKSFDILSSASDTEAGTETEGDTESSSYIPCEEATQRERFVKFILPCTYE